MKNKNILLETIDYFCIRKKFWLLPIIIMLFVIAPISAFTIDDKLSYEPTTKEYLLKNFFGFGKDIARMELNTPQINYVSRGYNKVVEIQITNYNDYSNVIENMEFYEINNGMKEFTREFDYKYKVLVDKTIDDYTDILIGYEINGTAIYKSQITGSHIEKVEEWIPLEKNDFLKGENITLGIFTNVKKGDNVEWIITAYGERLTEWAVWTEDLNVGLLAYYNFDESSGDLINLVDGIWNGTVTSITSREIENQGSPTGINKGYKFDGTSDKIDVQNNASGFSPVGSPKGTISIWFNATFDSSDLTTRYAWMGQGGGGGSAFVLKDVNGFDFGIGNTGIFNDQVMTNWFNAGDWTHLLITWDDATDITKIYINGTLNATSSVAFTGVVLSDLDIGDQQGLGRFWSGVISEVGIWDRVLNSTEISDLYNSKEGITFSGFSNIDVVLNSPGSGTTTSNSSIIFNATLNLNLLEQVNITNATFFMWHSNNSIFNQTTTILSGNVSLNVSYNISGFITDTFTWNVESCISNSTSTSCFFAPTNFTFTWQPFTSGTEIFNSSVNETSRQTFSLNITTLPSILSVSAFLNYNGSRNNANVVCSGIVCNLSSALDIPLVVGGSTENKTFLWEITIFDGSSSFTLNTSTQEQVVGRIDLVECNSTFTTKTLNFTSQNEINLSRVNPFRFDGSFQFWLGEGDVKRNNSFKNNSLNEINLCLFPNATMKIDAQIEYNEPINISFVTRNYYFQNSPITKTRLDISLFLLPSTSSTSFILKVQDENLLPIADALIEIHRFYPGEGIFRIVQIAKTDDNGKTIGFFETETVDYKFIIKKNGVILLETGQQKVIPETSPFTLTFNTGTDLGEPWASQNDISNLNSTLTWDSNTGIVTYIYIDSSNNFTQSRLFVQQTSLTNSSAYLTICNDTSSLSSATITCNVGNSSGFYIASSFIRRTGEGLDRQISFQIETFSSVVGLTGLFLGWFLILIASFMFKFDEVAGIWATTITIFLVNIMGLIKFGAVFVTAIFGISIILTWVMEK